MPVLRRMDPGRGAEVPLLRRVPRPGAAATPARCPSGLDRFLVPVGRPASAIAAGYLGLFSLLPFFGIIAIIVSLVAFRTLKRNPQLLGRGRAWFGLVMGIVTTVLYAIPIAIALVEVVRRL